MGYDNYASRRKTGVSPKENLKINNFPLYVVQGV
jgi:hypothetical protein